jgi:hypothetical protein
MHLAAKPLLIFGVSALRFDEVLHELAEKILIGAFASLCRSGKRSLQFRVNSDCDCGLGHARLLKAKICPQRTMKRDLARQSVPHARRPL